MGKEFLNLVFHNIRYFGHFFHFNYHLEGQKNKSKQQFYVCWVCNLQRRNDLPSLKKEKHFVKGSL